MNRTFEKEIKSLSDDHKNAHDTLIGVLVNKIEELENLNDEQSDKIGELESDVERDAPIVAEMEEKNRNQEEVIKTLLAENEKLKERIKELESDIFDGRTD